VRDAKLAGDVAGSDAIVSQFDDSLTDHIGQWTTVDEHATQLVDATVTCARRIIHCS